MNYEREAKKIADKLLEAVGLEPQLGRPEIIQLQMEDGPVMMTLDRPVMGVPLGTLLPATCSARYRRSPSLVDPDTTYMGTVHRLAPAELSGGKRCFMVHLPGISRGTQLLVVPSGDIELTHVPLDWGNTKRTRLR